jgi:hypothetical protein
VKKFMTYFCVALFWTPLKAAPPKTKLKSVSFEAHKNMNSSAAVRVDLIIIYEETLAKKLQEMSATAYFDSIEQLRRDNLSNLVVYRWEIPPSGLLENYPMPIKDTKKVWAVIVFADYWSEKAHRLVIGPDIAKARIILNEDDLVLDGDTNYSPSRTIVRHVPFEATVVMDKDAVNAATAG